MIGGSDNKYITPKYIKYIESDNLDGVLNTGDKAEWHLAQTFNFIDELNNDSFDKVKHEQILRSKFPDNIPRFFRKIISLLFYDYEVCPLGSGESVKKQKENAPKTNMITNCQKIQMRPMYAANILMKEITELEDPDKKNIKKIVIQDIENHITQIIKDLSALLSEETKAETDTKTTITNLLDIIKKVADYYASCLLTVKIETNQVKLLSNDGDKGIFQSIEYFTNNINKAGNITLEVPQDINTHEKGNIVKFLHFITADFFTDTEEIKRLKKVVKNINFKDIQLTAEGISDGFYKLFEDIRTIKNDANKLMQDKLTENQKTSEGAATGNGTAGADTGNGKGGQGNDPKPGGGGKRSRKKPTKKPSPYQKTPYKHTDKHGVERVVYTKGAGKYVRVMDKKNNKMVYKKVG